MRVSQLAALVPDGELHGADCDIVGLSADSRTIRPGETFIALKGSLTDGHRFIEAAAQKGAGLIIAERGQAPLTSRIPILTVGNTAEALKHLLPRLYPGAAKVGLIGVTGTSGKTSTTLLLEAVLKTAGHTPGIIGTIDTHYQGQTYGTITTTPGPIDLFATLDRMHTAGVDICAMEVSSHALDQRRIEGLVFDYAVFTNLSLDHLDYHADMHAYFEAKKRLFTDYLKGRAVINRDDMFGKDLLGLIPQALTFGQTPEATVRAVSIKADLKGLTMDLALPGGMLTLTSTLLGTFQASNIMAAAAVAHAMGMDGPTIARGIACLKGIPGRMEPVENHHDLTILVDYAHKPEALEKALLSVRGLTPERVVTVFGCGGDRDRSKRPVMGSIAARLADLTIVTSDNPRSEDPRVIIDEIVTGIEDRSNLIIEPDRTLAIRMGLKGLKPGDCLLIAGKGHETYQLIGGAKLPFDDKMVVQEILKELV